MSISVPEDQIEEDFSIPVIDSIRTTITNDCFKVADKTHAQDVYP